MGSLSGLADIHLIFFSLSKLVSDSESWSHSSLENMALILILYLPHLVLLMVSNGYGINVQVNVLTSCLQRGSQNVSISELLNG